MKEMTILLAIGCLFACKLKLKDPEEAFRNKHTFLTEKETNKLKLGATILFGSSETMGIDRSRFPSPSYSRSIDTSFFKYIGAESFYPEGCAGCSESTYNIYRAVKKGSTNITETKTTYKQDQPGLQIDTTEVVGKYTIVVQ